MQHSRIPISAELDTCTDPLGPDKRESDREREREREKDELIMFLAVLRTRRPVTIYVKSQICDNHEWCSKR
jgi:hypothetical protein